jgi:hypothetical protein
MSAPKTQFECDVCKHVYSVRLKVCPLHQHAPELLGAAKELLCTAWYGTAETHRAATKLEAAISKAEGAKP